jgi:DNA-binding MarR family transcriptional regulator
MVGIAMIEIKPTHAQNACIATSCFGLTKDELQFTLKFPGLNHTEKLVWIVLAALSANDPDFTRQMTLHQFAKMLNMRMSKVWRIILELEAMGFIHANPLLDAREGTVVRRGVMINLLSKKIQGNHSN